MNASRQDMRRAIDFSAVRDPRSIQNAIQGLLTRRSNPMREKEIARWFRATPPAFISSALTDMCSAGRIKASRSSLNRNRCVLAYWVEEEVS